MACLTLHYHELALKGANRPRFVRALVQNARRALGELGPCRVESTGGRILVETGAEMAAAVARAVKIPGVVHVMPVTRLPRDLDAVAQAAIAELRRLAPASFRVSAKRNDKSFPMTSVEIDRQVGARVHEALGIPVQLKGADREVHLAVLPEEILLAAEKVGGPGGLPTGTGGRVAALLSGGLDSPVAAWRMIKRGCRCDLVHFHSHPLVDRTTQEKAKDLAEVLAQWQFRTRLWLVPLAEIQKEVRLKAPEAMRVILYRRFMVRIAQLLARRRRCRALVTGESLGQVASQTLENIATVDAVAVMPILRPLVGTDKQEIITLAQKLGTYNISIRQDQDCCQLFVPPKPATKSWPSQAEAAEAELDVKTLVDDALARTERVDVG
ncbi:MAG TPA: tRNA uracil 4-sulfurtransferase ThiI [Planctomycetota bacterium]|nr:tRNA uracil 4-sulfurtransferase ThiI [Planctomycetota bacterium]